jgi:hypothetical protein
MSERTLKLYDIPPAYVRQQDESGHTRDYLAAADNLLDRLYRTLTQYYADNFPDLPLNASEPAAQEWLLPYFADLLDVRLVSPLADGKRAEIAKAVRWRQRKGTLTVVDEVAEAVGQWEVVVQEAWRRLAMTPRLNEPLLPEAYFGIDKKLNTAIPAEMAKHPGLGASTVDFRIGSRAVADEDNNPNSQVSTVGGVSYRWRQQYPHGFPCHHQHLDATGNFLSAAFDDVSKRTPDFRNSDWRVGHFHPRKILLHLVQPEGFFPTAIVKVQWQQTWLDNDEIPSDAFLEAITLYSSLQDTPAFKKGTLVFENRELNAHQFKPVKVNGLFKLGQIPISGVGPADPEPEPVVNGYHFAGLVLSNRVEVDTGVISFDRCAVKILEVHSRFSGGDPRHLAVPVINARDSLFRDLQAATSLTRLEYCTVLKKCVTEALQASDCIFTCLIRKDITPAMPPSKMCLRYSRILPKQLPANLDQHFHNSRAPLHLFSDEFGSPSCGVLHPATDASISQGAEDGTEMGAYHFLFLSLRFAAVEEKLKDYLPIGFESVVIPDEHLTRFPELMRD